MSQIYQIDADGSTTPLKRVHCTNEGEELQRILERNPALLPGEQIDPERPRRWLLIKREMPVPDPSTGGDRWSVDFLFADQDAVPTFVECKRFKDARSRREVVGQVLEYIASGHHYWTKEELRDFAEASLAGGGGSLDAALQQLDPELDSTDAFFERMQENLREAQVRVVFFMEESPMELRSLVDFLNKQMERSEVLLVEARQYEQGTLRLVAPMLFGYTEEARQVKRTVSVSTTGTRAKWDRTGFLTKVHESLSADQANVVVRVLRACEQGTFEVRWGTGKRPSLIVRQPDVCPRTIFAVYADGSLWLPFGDLQDPSCRRGQDELKALADRLQLDVPADWRERWLSFDSTAWMSKADLVLAWLQTLGAGDADSG